MLGRFPRCSAASSADVTASQRPEAASTVISEKLIVKVHAHSGFGPHQVWHPESLSLSEDGRHLAYVECWKGRWSQVVDGKPGKEYDGIKAELAQFSP